MKRDLWNKCVECGRLIAYVDFADGRAKRIFVTPSSEFSDERYETFCAKHAPQHLSDQPANKEA